MRNRKSFRIALAEGLDCALRRWAEEPGALTIARNGGAELAMRGYVLGEIEARTNCIAFTESENSRADTSLWTPRGELRAAMEFKHNLLHRHQLPSISANRRNADRQLAKAHRELRPESTYYVHFIFELELDRRSRLGAIHNSRVRTRYKEFVEPAQLQQLRMKAYARLGEPFGAYPLVPRTGARERATLVCWAYEMEPDSTATAAQDGPMVPAMKFCARPGDGRSDLSQAAVLRRADTIEKQLTAQGVQVFPGKPANAAASTLVGVGPLAALLLSAGR
jgi:hypothetical protein